jgi:formate dehydrogenase subunit gamma
VARHSREEPAQLRGAGLHREPAAFIALFRDNLPKKHDFQWIKVFGGMLSKSGKHVPSGRFNAGEKALFWSLVCFFSVVLCISGAVLLFPNFDQGRSLMQSANVVHVVCALLAIAMSCFHIFLGTIGMKGAYDAMHTGYVDETWAKEHHEISVRRSQGASRGSTRWTRCRPT